MIRPNVDDVLAAVIATVEREIAPEVDDEYAASLCRTVSQLLRSVRARVAHEGQALSEDNQELRELLASLRGVVSEPVGRKIGAALAGEPPVYRSVADLQQDAIELREALVDAMTEMPTGPDNRPEQQAICLYLQRQLERQRPWLVDAFTGPRR